MKRDTFLRLSGLCLGMIAAPPFLKVLRASGERPFDVNDYFESDDPAVLDLVDSVYRKCILNKIMPPEDYLRHRWITPGGGYRGQWIWDTMFVADLLAVADGQKEVIRDVFRNYRDMQARWDEVKPDYMQGMIPCMILPDNRFWSDYPAFSQIPILAWGLQQVYKRNGDLRLVYANLEMLENFHEWYWRERDVTGVGLVSVGAYSGDVQHARFETFDFDGSLDGLDLTKHPAAHNVTKGEWYGDILVTGNSSYLLMAERSLAELAEAAGEREMAQRRMARYEKGAEAMRKYMWDSQAGMFFAVRRDTLEKIPQQSIGCWMPLLAGVPTREMAARMAQVLETDDWMTPVPVATIPRSDPRFEAAGFWRGDAWTVTSYQVAAGIKAYGYDDLAARIADATVENTLKNGVSEHHDSETGQALGVDYLGMSCTVVTMMLEGLTKKYSLKRRNRF